MVKCTRKHSELPGNCSGTTPLTFIQSKIGYMCKNGQKWAKMGKIQIFSFWFTHFAVSDNRWRPRMVKCTRKHSELPGNCSGTTPLTFIQSTIGSRSKNKQTWAKWAKSKYLALISLILASQTAARGLEWSHALRNTWNLFRNHPADFLTVKTWP